MAGSPGHPQSRCFRVPISFKSAQRTPPATVNAASVNPGTNALGLAARTQEPQIDSAGIILNGGRLAFSYKGVAGKIVVIETSSDLMNWVPVHTNSLADEARQFTDCQKGDGVRKFYRLIIIQPPDR
jgi:hypothetical protein